MRAKMPKTTAEDALNEALIHEADSKRYHFTDPGQRLHLRERDWWLAEAARLELEETSGNL